MWFFIGRRWTHFIGLEELPQNREEFRRIMESPMLPHLPKRVSGGVVIKSPFLMNDIIKSVEEEEHEINSTPHIHPDIIKTKNQDNKVTKKKMDSRGEQLCRDIMEDIYKKPFPKIKPGFIRNPETQALLELDGYNAELGIAFEYNGMQHYVWPNFTGQSYNEFKAQVRRDQFKLECCDRHNVYLITIPYSVPYEDIREFITYYLPENVAKRLNEDLKE
jgi:hypothetical protein